MALIWKVPVVVTPTAPTPAQRRASYFKHWYAKNRLALAVQRAERYRDDPVYRAKMLKVAARQRAKAGT